MSAMTRMAVTNHFAKHDCGAAGYPADQDAHHQASGGPDHVDAPLRLRFLEGKQSVEIPPSLSRAHLHFLHIREFMGES
jgi:hypothetical protein